MSLTLISVVGPGWYLVGCRVYGRYILPITGRGGLMLYNDYAAHCIAAHCIPLYLGCACDAWAVFAGPEGDQGPRGPAGVLGPVGPQGPKGPTGSR